MATLSYINIFAGNPPSRWLDQLNFDVIDFQGNTITLDNKDGTFTVLHSDASGFAQGSGGSFDGNIASMQLIDPNQGNLLLQEVTGINIKIEELTENLPDAAYFILGEGSTINVNSIGVEEGSEIWNYQGADIWNIGQDGVTVHADNIDGEVFTFGATSVGPIGETISYRYNADGTLNTDGVRLDLSLNGIQDLDFLREGSGSGIGVTDPFAEDTFFGVNHAIGSEGNDYIRGAAWIGNTVWLDPNAAPGSNVNLSRIGSTLEGGGGDDTLERAYVGYGGQGDDYITIYAGGEINHQWTPGSEDYPDFGPAGNVFNDPGANGGGAPVDYFTGGGHAHGGNGSDTFQLLPGTLSTAVATTIQYYIDGDSGSDWINGAVRFSGVNGNGERTILPFDATDFSTFGIFTLDVNLSTNFANLVLGINTTSSAATQIVYEVHNIENVRGTNKSDRIVGDDNNNIIEGDDGGDELGGGAGVDTLSYEHSDAAVNIDLSTSTVSGGHADGDLIFEFENVMGSDHNDDLIGDDGDNIITGGNGNDLLDGGGDGSNGDTASYFNAANGVTVSLANTSQQNTGAGVDTLINIENLTGSDFADALTGNNGSNTLIGKSGNDTLNGGAGADIVEGGIGADMLDGGGNGSVGDTLSYTGSAAGVTVFLASNSATGGDADGDTIVNFENISGSDNVDFLYGDTGTNTINGNGGADWLYGGDGGDTLNGSDGADLIFGEAGIDVLYGGADGDFMWGGTETDHLFGGDGVDWLRGEDGLDYLMGEAGDDILIGGTGNDEMTGGIGTDTFYGEADNDTINGNANGDVAFGQEGDDIINGGSEGDFLFGGTGKDTINGGTENDLMWGDMPGMGDGVEDVFVFEANWGFDAVYDFEVGTDSISFAVSGLTQFSDLTLFDGGTDVTVAFGADAVTLYGVTLAELNANVDFDFM